MRKAGMVTVGVLMIAFAAAFLEDCDTPGGCVNQPILPGIQNENYCYPGGDVSGTITPTVPTPLAGFSSGSWGGSPSPAVAYRFGIIDAASGAYWCSFPDSLNPFFVDAADALSNAALGEAAFWYLTSNYYAVNTCGLSTTPEQWGQMQADQYVSALDLVQSCCIDMFLGDVETIDGDWLNDDPANNIQVIASFFWRLCQHHGVCNNGVYSSPGDWPRIVGTGKPYLNTSNFWLASYGPSQAQLNEQQEHFTTNPGGYYIYSWQYTDGLCYLSLNEARTLAMNAEPPIPRFDKWTNSEPNIVC